MLFLMMFTLVFSHNLPRDRATVQQSNNKLMMQFTGKHSANQSELKIRMLKFGAIRNEAIHSDTFYRREELITKMRQSLEEEKRKVIIDLVRLHPYPRFSGPHTGTYYWEFRNSTNHLSCDMDKRFLSFVTFSHSSSQSCGTWKVIDQETTNRMDPKYNVTQECIKLQGPASTNSTRIIYTCNHGKCSIECPCLICTTVESPCSKNCAELPCLTCEVQCDDHFCDLERTFSDNDSFSIPFYGESLEEEYTEDQLYNRSFIYAGRYREKNFIKYAGIPRNCFQCQIDL